MQGSPVDITSDDATHSIAALLNSIDSAIIIDDMQEVAEYFETLRDAGVTSFLEIWHDQPSTLDEVLSRIETIWLNPKSVRLFKASSHEELMASLPQAYAINPHPFVDFLEAVFQGEEFFQAEYEYSSASGEQVSLCVTSHMTIMGDRLASICTFTDTNWYSYQRHIADSEERYVKALKGTELGVWELNLQTNEFLLDSEYQSLIGMERTSSVVQSDTLMARVHVNDRARLNYITSDGEFDREFRVQRTDGATIWVHEKGAVTEWSSQGDPRRAAGTLRDVTLTKREQALHEVENQILEASMEGSEELTIMLILANGVERAFLNHACCVQLFHQEAVAIAVGGARFPKEFTDALVGTVAEERPGTCRDSIRDRRFVYVGNLNDHPEYAEIAPDLKAIGIHSGGSMPIQTRDNAVLGTITIASSAIDQPPPAGLASLTRVAQVAALVIQQRQQAEIRKLSEQQTQNRYRFESLGRLAGGVAHDFNNLLTAIVINAQLCEVKPSDAGVVSESAQRIQQAADVAASLCRQMLTYAGKVETTHQPINLRGMASSIAELVRSSIDPRVTLHVDETQDDPTIIGAEGAVSQVILNLLTNAFESIDGPGQIRVTTGIRRLQREAAARYVFGHSLTEGEYAYVSVSDTGCGMTDESKTRLFDPFYSTKDAGHGLGLSTVFGIVQNHKAALKVDTELGKGTQFEVVFPLPSQVACETTDERSTSSSDKRRVLVVDDQPEVLASICQLLRSQSIQCHGVQSGQEGLTAMESKQFDLVLMDQQMPGLSGLEAYRILRQRNDKTLICFMTGFAATSELETVNRLDENTRLIQKPFGLEQLQSVLRKS